MNTEPLILGITGNTGVDYCTLDDEIAQSPELAGRWPGRKIGFQVPTGAHFAWVALHSIFDDIGFSIGEPGGKSRTKKLEVHLLLPHKRYSIPDFKNLLLTPDYRTLPSSHVLLDRYNESRPSPDSLRRIIRVRKAIPLDEYPVPREAEAPPSIHAYDHEDVSLLLFHHRVLSSRRRANSLLRRDPPGVASIIENLLKRFPTGSPRIIVDLAESLPTVGRSEGDGAISFGDEHDVWNLLEKSRDRVCVICSSRMLRHDGALLSRHISWERTVEDIVDEIDRYDRLRMLAKFRHLIIRFGVVGALHIHTPDSSNLESRTIDLVFSPEARDLVHRERVEDGDIVGENTVLAAALIRDLLSKPSDLSLDETRRQVSKSISVGLKACTKMFDEGYADPARFDPASRRKYIDHPGGWIINSNFVHARSVFEESRINGSEEVQHSFGEIDIPGFTSRRPQKPPHGLRSPYQKYFFLRDALDGKIGRPGRPVIEGSPARTNVGMAVALYGLARVINRNENAIVSDEKVRYELLTKAYKDCGADDPPDHITLDNKAPKDPRNLDPSQVLIEPQIVPIYAPVLRLGNLTVIERSELESVRVIRNLLKNYLELVQANSATRKPLSIAVFGPPGAGKSFAVKQIVQSVNQSLRRSTRRLEILESNVAQFRSIEDLEVAFGKASSTNNRGHTPVIFFDEFDCSPGTDQKLGWLRYFLGPMNDGEFHATRQMIYFGPAVLVFAGGVFSSFKQFDREAHIESSPIDDGESTSEIIPKNPNQTISIDEFRTAKGPDFVSRLHHHLDILPINNRKGTPKYIIRRAILLRDLMKRHGLTVFRGDQEEANIDPDILYALLTIDRYRHGLRSMENLIAMCRPLEGRIEKGSLPPADQLAMHLDEKEFMIRMSRSRWRRSHTLRYLDKALRISDNPNDDMSSAGKAGKGPPEGGLTGQGPIPPLTGSPKVGTD